MDDFACTRHPDTETRLRCSACETPICPSCWVEAAVGYQCPDCAAARGHAAAPDTSTSSVRASLRGPGRSPAPDGSQMPVAVVVRAAAVGLLAAAAGGLLLGPVLQQGTLFLISSGAIGWGVARAVFWGAGEASTPLVRGLALAFAGATAAVGLLTAGAETARAGMLLLAYPAAVYGGWIVVRRR